MTLEGRRILYISYNGMLDPLGQSQVLPYLKQLHRLGVRFWLISFERSHAFTETGRIRAKTLREELSQCGIEWHVLRYHQKPSLPATSFDVANGVRLGASLMRKHKIEMVHARAQVPAVMALALKRRFGAKMIFDVRGLMAEEYVDAGHWRPHGVPKWLTKTMEARSLRTANGIVTLTDALWDAMQSWPAVKGLKVAHQTIPCCVDLNRLRFDQEQREARRNELQLGDRFVLIYCGSVGGWYMTDEMAKFFSVLRLKKPQAFFLWLTHGSHAIVSDAMQRHEIPATDYAVKTVEPAAIPNYLSAADAGIAFFRPGISRLGTSPVKVSEYLACGLPIIINARVGDSDQLVTRENVGARVQSFSVAEYDNAIKSLEKFVTQPNETRRHTRAVAERLFDLGRVGATRYAALYKQVLRDGA